MADNELGRYLRARREAVSPADLGLPPGPRRRTPGLRRAELAILAGVSVEYLTRLEQGRDTHPSAQVLGALADALRLPVEERDQLRLLAKPKDRPLCTARPPGREVRPSIRALVDRFDQTPAYVANRLGEILAHTPGFSRLADSSGLLDGDPPSLPRYVFTNPRARTLFPDWDRVAGELVSALWIEACREDPATLGLVDQLTVLGGAAFADRIATPPSAPRRTGTRRYAHPDAGELRLDYETLDLPDAGDQTLVVLLPADDASAAALDRLSGLRPGALRAV